MLEGFKVIIDRDLLGIIFQEMLDIRKKLVEKKLLTMEEEKRLKLYLWADCGPGRSFEDDSNRLRLIDQWLKEAVFHGKSLKEQGEGEDPQQGGE